MRRAGDIAGPSRGESSGFLAGAIKSCENVGNIRPMFRSLRVTRVRWPLRPSQHIAESESFRILERKLPKPWIHREVTERDYGIDLYVEIVDNNEGVTGKMAGLQVKAVDQIEFKNGKATRQRQEGDRGDGPATGRAALAPSCRRAALTESRPDRRSPSGGWQRVGSLLRS